MSSSSSSSSSSEGGISTGTNSVYLQYLGCPCLTERERETIQRRQHLYWVLSCPPLSTPSSTSPSYLPLNFPLLSSTLLLSPLLSFPPLSSLLLSSHLGFKVCVDALGTRLRVRGAQVTQCLHIGVTHVVCDPHNVHRLHLIQVMLDMCNAANDSFVRFHKSHAADSISFLLIPHPFPQHNIVYTLLFSNPSQLKINFPSDNITLCSVPYHFPGSHTYVTMSARSCL